MVTVRESPGRSQLRQERECAQDLMLILIIADALWALCPGCFRILWSVNDPTPYDPLPPSTLAVDHTK